MKIETDTPSRKNEHDVIVHFCAPEDQIWSGIGENYEADIAELVRDSRGSVGAWLLRTYIELRRTGYSVTVSNQLYQDRINISDAFSFGRRKRLNDCFVVIARSDGPMPSLANFVIHQNAIVEPSRTSANIPHWPQPGIIPRDPKRGSKIERLTFKGEPWNLDERFRTTNVIASLKSMGIALDLPTSDRFANSSRWSDYRTSDLVIAVRNLTAQDAAIKPASKLINAWIAGVPALLGPEPAFQELRRTPLDYIEIKDAKEMLREIKRLKDNPNYYTAMVANGLERAEEFSSDRIARQWQDMLNGPILEAYWRWKSTGPAWRWLQVARMHLSVGKNRRSHIYRSNHGQRILD